ncbi:MAG: LysM peptidoglycan-binding domain-containing protein [Verrucomicrobiota bacterium]
MSNNRKRRRTVKSARHTAMGRARAQSKLSANVTEEHDWYFDAPDVRLTKIFTVVLLLHVMAFGGIVAFKMVDKASANTAITISSAHSNVEPATQEQREPAAEASVPVEETARELPPKPLRRDRSSENQYKVQAGDTLAEIARDLGVSAAAMREKNAIISDNELYPGRWLDIPTKEDAAEAEKVAVTKPVDRPAMARASSGSHYEVVKGDTAWGISRKLNVSFRDLMAVNGIVKPESLQIGQKLKVP